jgi:threonine dehydratase
VTPLRLPSLEDVRRARTRVADALLPLPLVPLRLDDAPAHIYLKLENLQAVGSYKLRGAGNVILDTEPDSLRRGIATASVGNLGQAVAWYARRLGFPCTIAVPEYAPRVKLKALDRYGCEVRRLPDAQWWEIMRTGIFPGYEGLFVHPVFDQRIMSGDGTMGLEILEALPDVEAIVVPFGGGAMACGTGAAARALEPRVRIYACEVETGAPLRAALDHDGPVEVKHTQSFVDGIGSSEVFPQIWPLLQSVVTDSIVVTLRQVEAAIRHLAHRHHVIAEGAGAASLAAALTGAAGSGKVVCIISGGNIDPEVLARILASG